MRNPYPMPLERPQELTYDDKQRVTAARYYKISNGIEDANQRVDS